MADLLIRNATVIDGTGAPGTIADVAIAGDRIVAVGSASEPARDTLDASGLVLAPGFIDMHSHTDHFLLLNPCAESKITQGVTTEVCGNCGFSPGPWLSDWSRAQASRSLGRYGLEPRWRTVAEFCELLEREGIGINFAPLIGHGTLRGTVIGPEARPPTAAELDRMRGILADELAAGAFGLSTGLIYPPGCFAETEEIVALARVVGEQGGFYATHMRNENDRVIEAVAEALRIGREGGCPVQISHHKACGRRNWGKVEATLAMIEAARANGLDVTCDQYPYVATSTSLSVCLEKWVFDSGPATALARLRDPATRARILAELRASASDGYVADNGGWSCIVVASVASDANRFAEGLNIAQIAERWGVDGAEAVVRLLDEEELAVAACYFVLCEADVERVMRHPVTVIGSDGSARARTGALAAGKPHPRAWGTFPRVLGHYVRERAVLPLETAIHKMTGLPARRLGLVDRGVIAPGAYADLVLFDPHTIVDTATFADPHRAAIGIEYVFVNGQMAVRRGELTHTRAGRVLRRRRE